MDNEWILYVKPNCSYSERAKNLVKQYNLKNFKIIDITDENKTQIYKKIDKFTNSYRLFPIIFENKKFIGGFTEMEKCLKKCKRKQIDRGIDISQDIYPNKMFHIIIPKGIPTQLTKFDGSPWYSLIAMIYLSKKHKDDCIVIPKRELFFPKKQSEISLRWDESKQRINVPKDFWLYFNKCNGSKRFIVFPFGFSCKEVSHANYILYDTREKTMERFEPYGDIKNFINYKNIKCLMVDVDKEIQKLFKRKFGKTFIKKYYKPLDYMNKIGLQKIQESETNEIRETDPGFCTAWSVWYTDLRLSNPSYDRKTLLKLALKALEKHPESLTSFIRCYCEFIVDISEKIKNPV
jgi:glutaredoxin